MEVCSCLVQTRLQTFKLCPPPPLLLCRMSALRDDLKALLVTAETPDEFEQFLISKKLLQVDQLALMASDEDRLEDKIFPVLKAASVPLDDLTAQIAVKKAWSLARTSMRENKKVQLGSGAPTDVLPTPTRDNIVQTWKRFHNFNLSGERLLTEQLIKSLYNELKAEPPKFSIYFLENLRTQCSLTSSSKIAMPRDLKPGVPIVMEEVIADEVMSSIQCYERGRAFFSTVAWVCIAEPTMFSFQDSIFMDDRLLELIQTSVDGRRPPASHFVAAWAKMMRFFSDEVRTSSRKLGALVRETSSWTSFWTTWSPGPSTSTTYHHPEGGPSAREVELQQLLVRKTKECKSLQQNRDKQDNRPRSRSPLRRPQGSYSSGGNQHNNNNKDNRGGKGGKGGGKGGKGGSRRK